MKYWGEFFQTADWVTVVLILSAVVVLSYAISEIAGRQNSLTFTVVTLAVLMSLQELNIDIMPILTGAGIVGLEFS